MERIFGIAGGIHASHGVSRSTPGLLRGLGQSSRADLHAPLAHSRAAALFPWRTMHAVPSTPRPAISASTTGVTPRDARSTHERVIASHMIETAATFARRGIRAPGSMYCRNGRKKRVLISRSVSPGEERAKHHAATIRKTVVGMPGTTTPTPARPTAHTPVPASKARVERDEAGARSDASPEGASVAEARLEGSVVKGAAEPSSRAEPNDCGAGPESHVVLRLNLNKVDSTQAPTARIRAHSPTGRVSCGPLALAFSGPASSHPLLPYGSPVQISLGRGCPDRVVPA
jgi:hypothetical protein